jgi:hypothetical protein
MIEDKFKDWLVEAEGKKLSTAQAYVSAINKINLHYTSFEHKLIDLFEVSDADELNRIRQMYDFGGKYEKTGETGHRTYINAIKSLHRFIQKAPKSFFERSYSTRQPKAGMPVIDLEFDFNRDLKAEAAEMSRYYELFYCLERTIRQLIVQRMEETYGPGWWEKRVKPEIQENVKNNILRENDTGFTRRSVNAIDYTTFGELRQIVRFNWEAFAGTFKSQNAFNNIMIRLNTLRVPIAHCTPLASDEALRLTLEVKDWFRLVDGKGLQ